MCDVGRPIDTALSICMSVCNEKKTLGANRFEDVGLETGSSYIDVCIIDGSSVSSANVGFMTTQKTCQQNDLSIYDTHVAVTTSGFEADIVESGCG